AMGFALPAAIGVQMAKPDATVLCVSGDGGFQMNIQELATVHRLGLPIKMVIIDNKYLGMVRQWQQLFYQRNYAETDLSDNPDFVEIAKAYRIHASRMSQEAMREYPVGRETGEQIDRFLRSPEPELLVFDCAPEANVFPMVPAGAANERDLIHAIVSYSISQYARDVDAHPECGFAAGARSAHSNGRGCRAWTSGNARAGGEPQASWAT